MMCDGVRSRVTKTLRHPITKEVLRATSRFNMQALLDALYTPYQQILKDVESSITSSGPVIGLPKSGGPPQYVYIVPQAQLFDEEEEELLSDSATAENAVREDDSISGRGTHAFGMYQKEKKKTSIPGTPAPGRVRAPRKGKSAWRRRTVRFTVDPNTAPLVAAQAAPSELFGNISCINGESSPISASPTRTSMLCDIANTIAANDDGNTGAADKENVARALIIDGALNATPKAVQPPSDTTTPTPTSGSSEHKVDNESHVDLPAFTLTPPATAATTTSSPISDLQQALKIIEGKNEDLRASLKAEHAEQLVALRTEMASIKAAHDVRVEALEAAQTTQLTQISKLKVEHSKLKVEHATYVGSQEAVLKLHAAEIALEKAKVVKVKDAMMTFAMTV